MTIDSAYDTLTTKDASLSLWDRVLVRIIQERCPYICGTLSASFKNLVPDWQESSGYFPEKFGLVNFEPEHSQGLRRILVDNYSVFYLFKEGVVTVTRV